MKRTVYLLENKSRIPGSYVVEGVQKVIHPGDYIALYKPPVSLTSNIRKSVYLEDIPDTKNNEKVESNSTKENK